MKFRNTVFFILLFVIVLGLYLSQTKREAAKAEQLRKSSDDFKMRVEEKMPELKKGEEINFIQVQEIKKEETFWLEKQDQVWQMVFPVRALADQAMAQGMAGMVKLAFNQKLQKLEGEWGEYGLDQPEMKIGVGTTADAERHFIYLGKEAPLGAGIFARWDDKNAYFVLPSAVKSAFRKTVYEMREKRVFMTPLPQIDRVYIQIGERTLDWTRRNGIWYWMEPIEFIGKHVVDEQMMAVLQVLSHLYIKEFIDDESDVHAAGISLISDRIQIRAGANSETVFLGKEETLKTAYYAHRENEKKLFLIDQTKVIQFFDLLDALENANKPKNETAVAENPKS